MSEHKYPDQRLKDALHHYRKVILWAVIVAALCWLIIRLNQLFVLLLGAYGIAILLDPIVSALERKRIPRTASVLSLGLIIIVILVLLAAYAVPTVTKEYTALVYALPNYISSSYETIDSFLKNWIGIGLPRKLDDLISKFKGYLTALGIEQLKAVGRAIGETVLGGYSFTVSLLNMLLLPFFVFYLARDLKLVHRFLGSFLSPHVRADVSEVGSKILGHVYVFFKGQLLVGLTLAVLYVIGLSLAGLPLAIVIGTITGLLGIVPYLGFTVGLVLATIITLVNDPSWSHFLLVWLVFFINNLIEAFLLTPKLVGNKMGIHPLGVLLALIVGGQLLGIVGLILAIPTAASIRVLFQYASTEFNISD